MKYKAIIETDEFENFEFFEDGNGKYMVGYDASATANGGWIPLHFTECNQESILDKIRAEIENHCGLIKEDHCRFCSYCNSVMGVREILEIIDKYTEESEG